MTTNHLQKIIQALKEANDEIYAHVRYNFRHDTWEVWVGGEPVEVNFKDHNEAEDRCENLNYEYTASKVLEIINNDKQVILCNNLQEYDWRKDPTKAGANGGYY